MSLDGYHCVLVLGGIRSGKSGYAESLVSTAAKVRYIATAAIDADDPEWVERLAAHRARRPADWATEEVSDAPDGLAALIGGAGADETLLVDDVGGWLTAVLNGAGWAAEATHEPVRALVEAVRACPARLVLVSSEVGLSLVPTTPAGRVFADTLGAANHALADVADAVVLVVAGQPSWIKQPGAVGGRSRIVPVRGAVSEAGPLSAAEVDFGPSLSLPIPDEAAAVAAIDRLTELNLPGSGLGTLAEVVRFAAGVQGRPSPVPLDSVRLVLVYGGHTGALSAGDPEVLVRRRVAGIVEGRGPLGRLAAQVSALVPGGVGIQIVDIAEAGLPEAAPVEERDAIDADTVLAALRHGWSLAGTAADEGVDALVLAAAGPGQDAAAAAVVAALTGNEPSALLPRVLMPGGRIDDFAWMERCAAIRDAMHRCQGRARDPKSVLATLGGADIAVAAGLLLGAANRRTPVIIDGPVGVAAALAARDLAAQSRLWLMLPDHGGHPTTSAAASILALPHLTDLGLGVGEGATALATLPLMQEALLLCAPEPPETPTQQPPAAPAPPGEPTEPEPTDATSTEPTGAGPEPEPTGTEPIDAAPTEQASTGTGPGRTGTETGTGTGPSTTGTGPSTTETGPEATVGA